MDRISLSKKLSLVGILVANCLGPISANAEIYQKSDKELQQERDFRAEDKKEKKEAEEKSDKKACQESLDKVAKAKTKFMNACRSNGTSLSDCGEILQDCQTSSSIEGLLDPVNVVGQVLGVSPGASSGGNKCSEYSYTDYKNELKELQREKKDAEKEMQDLHKEKIEKDKEIGKARADLQKEIAQSEKEKAKEDAEAAEEALNMEKAYKDKKTELEKQLREIQSSINKANNQKQVLIASRAGEIEKYKASILVCQATVEKQYKELQGNTSSSLRTGSLASASASKGGKKNAKATLMNSCVADVVAKRNAEAVAYQNKMKEIDEAVSNAQADYSAKQQELQTLNTQYQQSLINRQQKKQAEESARAKELQAKSVEMQALNTEYAQNQARIQTALLQAQNSINQASNELGKLEKEKPRSRGGSKSAMETMREAQAEYTGVSCEAVCNGTPLESKCKSYENESNKMRDEMGSGAQ